MCRVGPSRSGEWQDWLEKSASGTGTFQIYTLEKSFLLPAVRRVDWRWQLWLRPWRLFSVLQVRIEDSLNSDRTVGMYMGKSDICKVVCGKWMREKRRNSRAGPGFCLTDWCGEGRRTGFSPGAYKLKHSHEEPILRIIGCKDLHLGVRWQAVNLGTFRWWLKS